jgi:hypothetical protein
MNTYNNIEIFYYIFYNGTLIFIYKRDEECVHAHTLISHLMKYMKGGTICFLVQFVYLCVRENFVTPK